MELNINSPAYYAKHFEVDDEIYWFCREISKFVKGYDYSQSVKIVGIIPVIAPKEILDEGAWKESIKYDLKCGLVMIVKQVDFIEYANADIDLKKILMLKCLLDAVYSIRRKGKVDYERFKKDVLQFLNYTEEDVK